MSFSTSNSIEVSLSPQEKTSSQALTFVKKSSDITHSKFRNRELVPHNQVHNPRFNLKTQPHVSGGFFFAQAELPPPLCDDGLFFNERNIISIQRATPKFDLRSVEHFRSNLTWDESVSSHPAGVSEDAILELDNIIDGKPISFRSRKARHFLICFAGILFLLIGILTGLWAHQPFQQQQAVRLPAATLLIDDVSSDIKATEEQIDQQASESYFDYTANTDYLVGVYYYPWHGEKFHNGGGYMRKELSPQHIPVLGEYNDSDPNVIKEHMKMFRQANIGLLVTSWWGPNRLEDSNTKDIIMEHEDVGNLKIALHYETTSRVGRERDKIKNAKTDIQYMCENYFDHPNYYKVDGRPALFIYISRVLESVGTLEEALLTMRSTASKCGHNLYLIGDSVFEEAPDSTKPHVPFWYFDAVTNYDIYGSSGRPEGHIGTDRVDNYYRQQSEWKEHARRDDCRYIPATSPGYNDRGVRMESDHPPLSRRITSTSQEGSLFHYQLKQAKKLVDPKIDSMILVNSFNEWHEDTQIEPVIGDRSSWPFNFTEGIEYVGYGELYLDILGAATSNDEDQHQTFDYLL